MAQACGALHCFEVPDPPCNAEICGCPDLSFCHRKTGSNCDAKAGECNYKWGGWLQSMIGKYESAYSEWEELYGACKAKYHEFLRVDMECDAIQVSFETCMCQKNSCEHQTCSIDFAQCTLGCWEKYEELVHSKECLEKDRKIDWSATKKIECYVDVLLHDYTKDELKSKCGTDDCVNVAREEDYKECASICPNVDHDGTWPTVLSAAPGNVKIDGHQKRDAVSEFLLGDDDYKCDNNGAEVFTRHRGGAASRSDELRCTEHLDIDYQIPECTTCDPVAPPVCDAAFLEKWYKDYDDTGRIGCITDCCPEEQGEACFDPVQLYSSSDGYARTRITVKEHTHAWAYNRCECRECQEAYPQYSEPPPKYQCRSGAHTFSQEVEEN